MKPNTAIKEQNETHESLNILRCKMHIIINEQSEADKQDTFKGFIKNTENNLLAVKNAF